MLPKTINIAGMVYQVNVCPLEDRLGQSDIYNYKLDISDEANELRQARVLIHEIAHAWGYEYGLEEWKNETLIAVIANGLFQLLKDNDFSFVRDIVNGQYNHDATGQPTTGQDTGRSEDTRSD